ncbi:MAG: TPM domain-containing protein [Bacteroidales bacterium]|nr:TPM domain-containing protein [Bacteroidales bacterium]
MKHIFSDLDRARLDKLISESELKTKAQIVLATVKRSDSYAELPWKAFAMGASLAGLTVFVIHLVLLGWIYDTVILFSILTIFACGALLAALTLLFPGFARFFLSRNRRETESLQYAEALFLSRELFDTESRRGILILVSQFERQVVILPDKGVRDRLTADVLKNIISKMTKALKQKNMKDAMETGLNGLVEALCPPLDTGPDKKELANEIIE